MNHYCDSERMRILFLKNLRNKLVSILGEGKWKKQNKTRHNVKS